MVVPNTATTISSTSRSKLNVGTIVACTTSPQGMRMLNAVAT